MKNISSSPISRGLSALCRSIDTAYSSIALEHWRNGLNPDFPTYDEDFRDHYLLYNLLRKSRVDYFGNIPPSDDALLQKAIYSFQQSEYTCKYWNIKGYIPGTYATSTILAPEPLLWEARRKIRKLLGPFSYDTLIDHVGMSNGASTRLNRANSNIPSKFSGKLHVTRNCALLLTTLIWWSEPWRKICQDRYGRESDPTTWVQLQEGSVFFTVPKTSTSFRGAAKEPEGNLLFQKGIGAMLRRKLTRVGIDLNDQSRNQYLARCGSRTGSLATIDLSAASDSISLRLVKELLPPDWYDAVCRTRCEKIFIAGAWHDLEKVSSMGNGFTFELESLIFWALTSATVDATACEDRRIGIYGDDIICHHSASPSLMNLLNYCGFTINENKSFTDGPFRESCGGHYFHGTDVTPFYVKENLESDENKYHFLNGLNRYCFTPTSIIKVLPYVSRMLCPAHLVVVPPHESSKSGLYVPDCSQAPGLYYALDKCGYKYRVYAESWYDSSIRAWRRGVKTKSLRLYGGYLAWLSLRRDTVLETSTVLDAVKRVKWTHHWVHSSRWDSCEVILSPLVQ